jgi:hypothetical protein
MEPDNKAEIKLETSRYTGKNNLTESSYKLLN